MQVRESPGLYLRQFLREDSIQSCEYALLLRWTVHLPFNVALATAILAAEGVFSEWGSGGTHDLELAYSKVFEQLGSKKRKSHLLARLSTRSA
jgi:hypothetical protein